MTMPPVAINNLSFTYNGTVSPVLRNINLQVYPGQFLTITGPSGCGKSTLALCLAGFIPHAYPGKMTGSIHIQGKDTRDYPAGGLSGIVGLVQQDPEAQLCTLTVKDEIAFGPENLCLPPKVIRKRVLSALEAVGAKDLLARKVHTLSGGEKQRIAIASVLAMNPSLLILDEPTANLDPSCTREVLLTLGELKGRQKTAIIVLEHRIDRLAGITDRLFYMDKGRLFTARGPDKFKKKYVPSKRRHGPMSAGVQVANKTNASNNNKVLPLLTVENLRAGYAARDVFSDLSFSIYSGETLALMGDNGSGKTTLLLALLGLLHNTGGSIYFRGENITKMKASQRAREMGLVFQNPNHQIFAPTVTEEAMLPSLYLSPETPGQIKGKVKKLLGEFELLKYENLNPFTLSLGEKKRLTLLSVLAYAPSLLLLDEPLVGQDSRRLGIFLAALQKHRHRGGGALMICHEPEVVHSCCQRVLFLEQGKLLINAPVKEAFCQLEKMGRREYLPLQAEGKWGE